MACSLFLLQFLLTAALLFFFVARDNKLQVESPLNPYSDNKLYMLSHEAIAHVAGLPRRAIELEHIDGWASSPQATPVHT